jgi:WD40-like Beta Propeller Repeat
LRDGSRVAFSSNRAGRFDIYVMNADGTNPTRVTDGDLGMDAEPAWSPDGTRLVFASTRPFNTSWNIWMVNTDGSNLHELTDGFGVSPAWSPDGSTIAYVSSDQIWVVGADGGNPHALAIPLQGVGPMAAPAWSPDGSQLAFSVQGPLTGPSMATIFVSAADGSNPQQVTDWGNYFDSEPQWSSDGTTIMFQRYFGGSNPLELFATTLDRRFFAGVVTAPGDNYQPSWVAVPPPPPPPPPDTTPPTITLIRPNAVTDQYDVYTVGQVVLASYSCADEAGGSGLRHCFRHRCERIADRHAHHWPLRLLRLRCRQCWESRVQVDEVPRRVSVQRVLRTDRQRAERSARWRFSAAEVRARRRLRPRCGHERDATARGLRIRSAHRFGRCCDRHADVQHKPEPVPVRLGERQGVGRKLPRRYAHAA